MKHYKPRKYPPEVMAQAVELYAQGKTIPQVAREIGVPQGTVNGWYDRNYPENWTERREQRIRALTDRAEEETLEAYAKVIKRQQQIWKAVQMRLLNRIAKSSDADLATKDAIQGLPEAVKEERKLYADLDLILRLENKAGPGMGIATQIQDKEGNRTQIMSFLTDSFNQIHGTTDTEATDSD